MHSYICTYSIRVYLCDMLCMCIYIYACVRKYDFAFTAGTTPTTPSHASYSIAAPCYSYQDYAEPNTSNHRLH